MKYQDNIDFIKDYDDAVALYKDARDHPEKHQEWLKEFMLEYNHKHNYLKIPKEDAEDLEYIKWWASRSCWRDFLFRKIFEEE